MRQAVAEVISNEQILKELERPDAQTFKRPSARNILGSWLIWLSCPEIAQEAQPGQFVMAHCGEDCLLRRPFSIHQLNENSIALFFAAWENGKAHTGYPNARMAISFDAARAAGQRLYYLSQLK